MKTGVYVSRLGGVLRDRKLPVSELRRRLGQRGHTVSRGALDRLMSERPLRTVDLDVLMPVLEELDVEFRAAFEHVPAAAVEAQLARQPVVRQAARMLGRRQALAAADAELRDAANRLEGELRRPTQSCSTRADGSGSGPWSACSWSASRVTKFLKATLCARCSSRRNGRLSPMPHRH